MISLGVDPGLAAGAIACIEDGVPTEYTIMPRIGDKGPLDWAWIAGWIRDRGEIDLCVLEKVHSMPGQGVSSTFSFGQAFGGIQAVLEVLGVPYQLVTPQAWKKSVLRGIDWKGDKTASVTYVRRRWPSVDLKPTPRSRKDSDNLADSICLAAMAQQLLTASTA